MNTPEEPCVISDHVRCHPGHRHPGDDGDHALRESAIDVSGLSIWEWLLADISEPDPTSTIPGMHICGWTHPVELEALIELAAPMRSVVEIGCFHGRSAFALLTACKGPVYCVDPWNGEHDNFSSFMENCGHFENLRVVRAYSSAELADRIGDVDMVFIDGAHAFEAVLADVAAWLPHTRRLMCGHDFQEKGRWLPGVQKAVDLVFGDQIFVPAGTSIWTIDLTRDWVLGDDLPTDVTYTDEYGRTATVKLEWP